MSDMKATEDLVMVGVRLERQRIAAKVREARNDAEWERKHAAIDKVQRAQAFGAIVAYEQVLAIIEEDEE